MYGLYSFLTAAGMLLLSPYFLVRGLASGKYFGQLRERLGWRFPPELRDARADNRRLKTMWIHAVSVGEVLAVLPLAQQWKERHPDWRLVVSTTTVTGQRLARERMKFADAIIYFPLDWKGPVRRALEVVRPAAIVIVETEIWPNLLRESRRAGVPVIFVNGRLSERSFRGFRRAISLSGGLLRGFLKRILNDATLFVVQSKQDAERLLALGADAQRVSIAGNLKYDFGEAPPTPLSAWLGEELPRSDRHPVIVAGSVLANEEGPILRAFADVERKFPRALLILAPRKPERFDGAARILEESRRGVIRRSAITLNGTGSAASGESRPALLAEHGTALLLDSLGELASIYGLADAVFVGGSLVPNGGHNILEPASLGKPPIYGSSMENFREMAAAFLDAGAALQVNSSETLAEAWLGLLSDTRRAQRMGVAARSLVEGNRGATSRALAKIEEVAVPTRSGE